MESHLKEAQQTGDAWALLIISDDERLYTRVQAMFAANGDRRDPHPQRQLDRVTSDVAGRAAMLARAYDAVLVDVRLGERPGLSLLRAAMAARYAAPLILCAAGGEAARLETEALEAGASAFLRLDETSPAQLVCTLRFAIAQKKKELSLRREIETLRDGEQRYHNFFDHLNEAIGVDELIYSQEGKAIDWRILDVNPAYLVMAGKTRAEVVGRRLTEIYGEHAPDLFLSHVVTAVTSGDSLQFEEFYPPFGRRVFCSVLPLGDKRFAIFMTDVSEQYHAQMVRDRLLEENRRQREMLQAVLNANPGGMAVFTLDDLTFRYANKAYRNLLLAPGQEVVGRRIDDVWPPEMGFTVLQTYLPPMPDGKPVFYDRVSRRFPDGSMRHFRLSIHLISWEGQAANLVVVWETTQLEEAREEAQRRAAEAEEGKRILDALMEFIPEGISIADSQNNVLLLSRFGQELLGKMSDAEGLDRVLDRWPVYEADGITLMPEERLPLVRATRFGEVVMNLNLVQVSDLGQRLYLSCNAGPIRDAAGKITGAVVGWHDITAQRASEEKIRYQASLLENINEAVISIGSDMTVTTWNRAAEEIYGWKAEEIIGRYMIDLVPSEYTGTTRENVIKVLNEQGTWKGEIEQIRKDGTKIDVLSSITSTRDEFGRLTSIIAINYDETERKKIERAIAEGRATLEAALSSMSDAVFISDRQGNFINFNEAFATFHRFKNKSECSKRFDDYPALLELYFPDGALVPIEMWGVPRALRGERASNVEYTLRRKDTGERWVGSFSFGPILGANGEIVGSVVVGRDITDLKRVQEVLQQSEARFRQLADAMPQLVWTATPDGNIDYINRRYHEYDGLSFDRQHGWDWLAALHPEDAAETGATWEQSVQTGQVFQTEVRFHMTAGGYRWHLSRCSPVKDDLGRVLRWFGTHTDIEDQKQIEDHLRRSNLELEQFAFVASHDMQEPLRKIMMFSKILNDRLANSADETVIDFLSRMQSSAERMQAMINGLLDLSRVNRRSGGESEVSLNRLAREVVSDLETRLRPLNGQVQLDDLPVIWADELQIRQLLLNLIGNAIKFHQADAPPLVRVSARTLQEGLLRTVVLEVVDNGIGFDQKYAERIFQPFQRLNSRSEYEGTGLGLAICRRIVERHHGWIVVTSTPGEGTVFSVYLPQSAAQA